MKRLQSAIAIGLSFYVLYLVKCELGINISQRYHAIDAVKLPLRIIYRLIEV